MRNKSAVSDTRLNNFDLIRLLASAQVVIVHICEHLSVPETAAIKLLGFVPGVPIFFFVSGFLVSQSLERSRSLTGFYRNRLLQVYPGLLVCFLVSLGLAGAFKSLPWTSPEFAAWVVAQSTIGQFYNPGFMRDFGVGVLNGSLWTIPVELQFYAVLPMVYFVARQFGARSFLVITAIGLLLHTMFLASIYGQGSMAAKLVQVTVLPWLGFFLVGVLAQRYWSAIQNMFRGKFLTWLAIYGAAALLIYAIWPMPVVGNRIPGPLALVLFGVILSAAYTAPDLSEKLLRGNDVSYGLYLYHAPLINVYLEAAERGIHSMSPVVGALIVFAVSILLAIASWLGIERPALALKGWLGARQVRVAQNEA